MDVNEQIAKAYFEEVHGYVVKANHYFKKIRINGTGPSDIDLIMYHPKSRGKYGKMAVCTIKGWQSHRISLQSLKYNWNKWRIFEQQEINEAKRFMGNKKIGKILLLPPIVEKDRMKAIDYCKGRNTTLIDFNQVICEILEHISKPKNSHRAYNSEFLQTMRMVAINLISIPSENKNKNISIKPNLVNYMSIKKEDMKKAKYIRGSIVI